MTVYLTSDKIWAYVTAGWTDITSDVVRTVSGKWGMVRNGPLDLLAKTGTMKFFLDNTAGTYSPYLAGALAGWGKGTKIKYVLTYDGIEYVRFRGVVVNLKIQSGAFGGEWVRVTVADWLDYAATHPMLSPGIQTDKRGDEALTTILDDMPIAPQATDFDEGINTFPTVFDMVTIKTKAYSEFSKIAFSEVGYTYLKKDKTYGETLVFESTESRHGLRELNVIPKAKADSGFLKKEDGAYLLKEDGEKIILDEQTTFVADNVMTRLDVEYGENVINRITNLVYPRRIDAAATSVLFSLAYPMQIGSGEEKTFRGNYVDPDGGGARVSGIEMVTPVINTDYKMWSQSDGGGDDLTADLTIVATYGTEGVTYSLTNDAEVTGWITLLQARGKGIYTYNPIEHAEEDSVSIDEFGYKWKTLHQKYKQDITRGALATAAFLDQEKQPRTKLNKIYMVANRSGALMMAFLNLDVGDLIHVKEDKTGLDIYAYIQGVEFSINPGGLVKFVWIVKEMLSLTKGLSLISCEFDASSTDALIYGYLSHVSGDAVIARSFSAWIYLHTKPGASREIVSAFGEGGGNLFPIGLANGVPEGDPVLEFWSNRFEDHDGRWRCNADAVPLNDWTHVLVTYELTDVDADPIFYQDGVSLVVTEVLTPLGALRSEEGANLVIGNRQSVLGDPYNHPFDGLIKDVRVYNVILTQAEATSLAAGGNITRGLVFQGPCVRTRELSDFEDKTLLPTDRMIDNIFGMVGKPNGSVITRLIT